MFLKRERPFTKKKYLVVKENTVEIPIFQEIMSEQTLLQKYSENVFAYSFVSEHSEHFPLFPLHKLTFYQRTPPP